MLNVNMLLFSGKYNCYNTTHLLLLKFSTVYNIFVDICLLIHFNKLLVPGFLRALPMYGSWIVSSTMQNVEGNPFNSVHHSVFSRCQWYFKAKMTSEEKRRTNYQNGHGKSISLALSSFFRTFFSYCDPNFT